MNETITLQIKSADYLDVDRWLRITQSEHKTLFLDQNPKAVAIMEARRALGFSMHPRHFYSDYDAERDEPKLCSYVQ